MKHWKYILPAAICLLCLLAFGLLWGSDRAAVASLVSQQAAARWETPEKPYAQVSVFLPEQHTLPAGSLGTLCLSLEKALVAGGVGPETHPWYFAASRTDSGQIKSDGGSAQAEVTAVTGQFFRVHPMVLLDGWYPDPEGVMEDWIVLNREAAWDLFYSEHVTGLFVETGGLRYRVAAVVDEEPGRYNALAAGDLRRAWIPADAAAGEKGFTCLEAVLPQPVKDFAAATLRDSLKTLVPEDTEVVDAAARFSLRRRAFILRHLTARGVGDGTALPWWEAAARMTENRLARTLVPEALLLLIPAGVLLGLLWRWNRRRAWGLRSIKVLAEEALDRKHQRDYQKKTVRAETEPAPEGLEYENR